MNPVPVFMYHHVNPLAGDMITVTPEVFEGHLKSLTGSGVRTLSLGELVDEMEGRREPEGKAVCLTFDDGYLDNFVYAFPLIKKYGVRAAVFLPTGWVDGASVAADKDTSIGAFKKAVPTHARTKEMIGERRFAGVIMDWTMAREMQDSGLVEFHSHTVTHTDCNGIPAEELSVELTASRQRIEEELNKPCRYLCWPRGRFNDDAVQAARASGYRGVFTTRPGVVKKGSDPFSINRIVVKDGPRWFQKRVRIYTNPFMADLYLKIKGRVL